jgi:hypothetical protein
VQKVCLVLIGSHGTELDRVELNVKDPQDCAREVLAAMTRQRWVLSVGDRVEIQGERE